MNSQLTLSKMVIAISLMAIMLMLAAMPADAQLVDPLDCTQAASDPEPNTPEYFDRDETNIACAQQRHADAAQHPLLLTPIGDPIEENGRFTDDPYRAPSLHSGKRFRFDMTTITTPSGQTLEVEVYRPCDTASCPDLPDALQAFSTPYPVIISVHGGASRKELHWWSSQTLAESGYMVISADDATTGTSPNEEQVYAVLNWLFSDENNPNEYGEFNPWRSELNDNRIGIAGHSAGGVLASRIGQEDSRISAVVSWDRAQSSTMPEDLTIRAPVMFQFADYNCQQVPVCQPEPYLTPPDVDGPGNKKEDFVRAKAADVDTMQIAIRAATHLDWTPPVLAGSRYGELTSIYFTLAWFDRYLRGQDDPDLAQDAFERLTNPIFDNSADIHNLSQGFYDPVLAATAADPLAGNVPYKLEGIPVANRLSFYYRSKCSLTPPSNEAKLEFEDMRALGCHANPAVDRGRSGAFSRLTILLILLSLCIKHITARNKPHFQ